MYVSIILSIYTDHQWPINLKLYVFKYYTIINMKLILNIPVIFFWVEDTKKNNSEQLACQGSYARK